jgi:hypothetical protein
MECVSALRPVRQQLCHTLVCLTYVTYEYETSKSTVLLGKSGNSFVIQKQVQKCGWQIMLRSEHFISGGPFIMLNSHIIHIFINSGANDGDGSSSSSSSSR